MGKFFNCSLDKLPPTNFSFRYALFSVYPAEESHLDFLQLMEEGNNVSLEVFFQLLF